MNYRDQLKVEWSPANGAWVIVGGGLPRGTCWSGHETQAEAEMEAQAISEDIGCEVVES